MYLANRRVGFLDAVLCLHCSTGVKARYGKPAIQTVGEGRQRFSSRECGARQFTRRCELRGCGSGSRVAGELDRESERWVTEGGWRGFPHRVASRGQGIDMAGSRIAAPLN